MADSPATPTCALCDVPLDLSDIEHEHGSCENCRTARHRLTLARVSLLIALKDDLSKITGWEVLRELAGERYGHDKKDKELLERILGFVQRETGKDRAAAYVMSLVDVESIFCTKPEWRNGAIEPHNASQQSDCAGFTEQLLAGPDDAELTERELALLEAYLKQPVSRSQMQREAQVEGKSETAQMQNKLKRILDFNRELRDGKASGDVAPQPQIAASTPYPKPQTYSRDKWIYENIGKNTCDTLSCKLREKAKAEKWEIISSRNGFKKAADRYAEFHSLRKRRFVTV